MVKYIKIASTTFILLLMNSAAQAQCAMCRATLENNFSNGEMSVGANINVGILYLFVFPYILIALVGFFWYKKSSEGRKGKA